MCSFFVLSEQNKRSLQPFVRFDLVLERWQSIFNGGPLFSFVFVCLFFVVVVCVFYKIVHRGHRSFLPLNDHLKRINNEMTKMREKRWFWPAQTRDVTSWFSDLHSC